jgi:uncharacterized SAM-binding protein YcdF (DUF218 family)
MNELLTQMDLLHWKPVLRALLLPPVPLLLLLLALVLLPWRGGQRVRGALLLAVAGLWFTATPVGGAWLMQTLTQPPPALNAAQRLALVGAPNTAVLVLGAGRDAAVAEFDGRADLTPLALARLRYGVWLARQTRLPLGFSGGLGHGLEPGPSEAALAAQVARQEFGLALRWREDRSRDTRENARLSVALLQRDGVRQIVLVTHAAHQRRALAGFRQAIAEQGAAITLLPAPMGGPANGPVVAMDWVPTPRGLQLSWMAVYEWLGQLGGA